MISGENAYILDMVIKTKFSYVRILDRTYQDALILEWNYQWR